MSDLETSDLLDQVVLGRYRIVRQLARGGMGAVYLGRTEGAQGFARPVVVKRILPWLTHDNAIAEMFVREARILSNMQHPNIVSVLDFGQQDDGSYLMVLDYVHGYELGDWLSYASAARGRIPVDQAIHIVGKILDALQYAHTLRRADGKSLGIIHRDVTPTNVFLSDQGVVKLLDFGIALVAGEERKFTGRNEVRGKLPYLPAEVIGGAAPSVASDVYSSGLTLYELLTCTNPFDGGQPTEIFCKILTTDAPPVSSLRDDVGPELDAVVARALARDPSQRYQSAAELAQALRALSSRSDDLIATELAQQLHEDFSAVPTKLGLVSLVEREQAWRGNSVRASIEATGQRVHADARAAQARAQQATVHAAETVVSPSPVPAAGAQARAPSAGTSLPRVLLIAGAAGVVGAAAVLIAWLFIKQEAPAPERMVVISKESASPDRGSAQPGDKPQPTATAETAPSEPTRVDADADPSPPTAATKASSPQNPRSVEPSSRPAAPDPEALSRTFARKQQKVQACFSKHASSEGELPQLTLHFHVAASGVVESATVQPAALADKPLGRCLRDVAKSTRFGLLEKGVSFHIPISTEKVLRSSL